MRRRHLVSELSRLILVVMVTSMVATTARANEAQRHIVAAGINLGQAAARMQLFGDAFGGDPPTSQLTWIATNLSNAAAEITAAEELFEEPFASNRELKETLSKVLRAIANYPNVTGNMNHSQRAKYIESIWVMYRDGLMETYYSGRPDSFQFNPTCDSEFLNVGYHCGRATIASEIKPPHRRSGARASFYQSGANSALINSIDNGLELAIDGRPRDYSTKVACSFGGTEAWDALPSLTSETPPEVYADLCGDGWARIPRIAKNAELHRGYPDLPVCITTGGHLSVEVPSLVGTQRQDAKRELAALGLQVRLVAGDPAPSQAETDTIQSQDPAAGTKVGQGSVVAIRVRSPYVDSRRVPSVVGMPADEAVATLSAAGITSVVDQGSSRRDGIVDSQVPAAGSFVTTSTQVRLHLAGEQEQADSLPKPRNWKRLDCTLDRGIPWRADPEQSQWSSEVQWFRPGPYQVVCNIDHIPELVPYNRLYHPFTNDMTVYVKWYEASIRSADNAAVIADVCRRRDGESLLPGSTDRWIYSLPSRNGKAAYMEVLGGPKADMGEMRILANALLAKVEPHALSCNSGEEEETNDTDRSHGGRTSQQRSGTAGHVAGTYNTSFGSVTLAADGSGTYPRGGQIHAESSQENGRLISGVWVQPNSAVRCNSARHGSEYWGRFEFRFNTSFSSFEGRYTYCDQASWKDWNGTKSSGP